MIFCSVFLGEYPPEAKCVDTRVFVSAIILELLFLVRLFLISDVIGLLLTIKSGVAPSLRLLGENDYPAVPPRFLLIAEFAAASFADMVLVFAIFSSIYTNIQENS